jgi:antitoxin VapB
LRDSQGLRVYFYHDRGVSTIMGAQLNIKSEDAYRLASRLAELTGESLTTVVTRALRTELDREEKQRDIEARVDRVLEIAREIRAHMREPVSSDTSWLYDENGLPK